MKKCVPVFVPALLLTLPLGCGGEEASSSPAVFAPSPSAAGPQAGVSAQGEPARGMGDNPAQAPAPVTDPNQSPTPQAPMMAAPPNPADPADPMDPANPADPTDKPAESLLGADADLFTWRTDEFTLDPGQERYLCFAKTLEEDLVVNGYASRGDSYVHHLIFSRTTAPEPEGFAECDVAFKNSWQILFITGAGDTKLEFPDDAGHVLPAGTQVVVQMHLLNVAEAPVDGTVEIDMRRSQAASPRPVNSFIFGTAAVDLPPKQTSTVVGTCAPFQNVQLIAGFPHMHLKGASMLFEVANGAGQLEEVFRRDPFSFDAQTIDPLDVTVAAGTTTRVTCTFDNDTDQRIGYGESTNNEMCYFVGFAVDLPGQSACLEVLPPNIFGP